jgi:hypothetical protein
MGFATQYFREWRIHKSGFVRELEALVDDPFVLLCDNARPHGDEEAGMQPHHHLHYLPHYSPFLKPAEMAGSTMKAGAKRRLSQPDVQTELMDHNLAHNQNLTLQGFRLNILRREMTAALDEITQLKCQNWFNHIMSYSQRCLDGEDIVA